MATVDQRTARDTGPAGRAVLFTSGTLTTAGQPRAVFIDVTTVGTLTCTFADLSTLQFLAPQTGIYEFNWALLGYTLSGGAATVYGLY